MSKAAEQKEPTNWRAIFCIAIGAVIGVALRLAAAP